MAPLSAAEQELIPTVQVSRFGVIRKGHQVGKWWLIVDLSATKGASVNDGVQPVLCSLVYTSVNEAVQVILQQGQGCELAKLDNMSAYRLIPVHPDNRPLLGMR